MLLKNRLLSHDLIALSRSTVHQDWSVTSFHLENCGHLASTMKLEMRL